MVTQCHAALHTFIDRGGLQSRDDEVSDFLGMFVSGWLFHTLPQITSGSHGTVIALW